MKIRNRTDEATDTDTGADEARIADQRLMLENLLEASKAGPVTIEGVDPTDGRRKFLGGPGAVKEVRRRLAALDGPDVDSESEDERWAREAAEADAERSARRNELLDRLVKADAAQDDAAAEAAGLYDELRVAVATDGPAFTAYRTWAAAQERAYQAGRRASALSSDARELNHPGDERPIPASTGRPPSPESFTLVIDRLLAELVRQDMQ